jgi:TPR repeat protein
MDLDRIEEENNTYRENMETLCLGIEVEIELEKDIGIKCKKACDLARKYEDLSGIFKNNFYHNKIHKYYLLAIENNYLLAFYRYGEWLNKRVNATKMCKYFTLGIEMYYNKDYYLLEDEDKEKRKEEEADIEKKITRMLETLGNYYDNSINPTEETNQNTIKYYLLAIERGSMNAMFNLGHYYYECNDYENMFNYYYMSVALGDIDTMFELAIYYQKIKDFDNMRKYYVMALEESENPKYNVTVLINDGKKDFDLFNLKEELDKIENKSTVLIRTLHEIGCIKEIMIFENKKKLFESFHYIIECGICYETKLHIDLKCGHCCCINCYPKLYKNPCPYCRL